MISRCIKNLSEKVLIVDNGGERRLGRCRDVEESRRPPASPATGIDYTTTTNNNNHNNNDTNNTNNDKYKLGTYSHILFHVAT